MLGMSVETMIGFAIALIPAFSVHEFAHAWAAYRLGDSTAKNLGRLTLNPLKHLDPLGTLMVLVAGFGWAKPVPVNPNALRGGRSGLALVAAAGPASNLLMAVAVAQVWQLLGFGGANSLPAFWMQIFVWLNVALLFFNLIPISPLDGFKVATGWLPEVIARPLMRTVQYGPLLLLGLILLGRATSFDVLGQLIFVPTNALVGILLG